MKQFCTPTPYTEIEMDAEFLSLSIAPSDGEEVPQYTYCQWSILMDENTKFLLEVDLLDNNEDEVIQIKAMNEKYDDY